MITQITTLVRYYPITILLENFCNDRSTFVIWVFVTSGSILWRLANFHILQQQVKNVKQQVSETSEHCSQILPNFSIEKCEFRKGFAWDDQTYLGAKQH